jgi:uncharacterized protein YggU (UPF0235/DUF167 family)
MEDLPWDVKVETDEFADYIISNHPVVLYHYIIKVDKMFATISLDTGISTDLITMDQRMGHYRRLLILNRKYNMLKIVLHGDEDMVAVESDLHLSSLGEKEFHNALHNVLFASYDVVKSFNLDEGAMKELEGRIPKAIDEMIAKGAANEEIMKFLTAKVGMEESEAKKWVEVARASKSEKKSKAPEPDPTQHSIYG